MKTDSLSRHEAGKVLRRGNQPESVAYTLAVWPRHRGPGRGPEVRAQGGLGRVSGVSRGMWGDFPQQQTEAGWGQSCAHEQ